MCMCSKPHELQFQGVHCDERIYTAWGCCISHTHRINVQYLYLLILYMGYQNNQTYPTNPTNPFIDSLQYAESLCWPLTSHQCCLCCFFLPGATFVGCRSGQAQSGHWRCRGFLCVSDIAPPKVTKLKRKIIWTKPPWLWVLCLFSRVFEFTTLWEAMNSSVTDQRNLSWDGIFEDWSILKW